MSELHTASYQARAAYELMRLLNVRIGNARQGARSGRFEHDELIQLAHQVRSLEVARDRARADWLGWKRIVSQLAPAARGSVSLAL